MKVLLCTVLAITAMSPLTVSAEYEQDEPAEYSGHEIEEETAWMEEMYPFTGEEMASPSADEAQKIYVEEILLNKDETSAVYGESFQLSASVLPQSASNKKLIWFSDDENIASVDSNGFVKALNPGVTMIHAYSEDGNAAAGCAVTVQFKDVLNPEKYYYEPVYWALRHDVTTGTGSGYFNPNENCTREQIVTFLWRSAGSPKPKKQAAFTDLKKGAWYTDAVSWAAENGITTGLNDGTKRFGVGMTCTREMCVTFLYRAAGSPSYSEQASFTDVRKGSYYEDAVSWAYESRITTGLNDGRSHFGTGVNCSRAMVVSFICRQKTNNVSSYLNRFETKTDASGHSYTVFLRNGEVVKENFKLEQTYYQVDPQSGEIIHRQDLFTDEIYMEGIDISEHNGELDFSAYENGFMIIRIAWGTNADILAKRNMDLCEQLKIPYGVYIYSYAINEEQVEWEADYVLDLIEGRDIRLGVWFDIEDDTYKEKRIANWPNASVISRHCQIFCDRVSAAGWHTGIYTSASWFDEFVKGLSRYDRWIAHWGYNTGAWAVNLNGKCSIHQFTSIPLDRDVIYVDPVLLKNPE